MKNIITGISRRQALGGVAALAATTSLPAFGQAKTKATLAYGSTGYTWASTFLGKPWAPGRQTASI
jgi:hypothetical protein